LGHSTIGSAGLSPSQSISSPSSQSNLSSASPDVIKTPELPVFASAVSESSKLITSSENNSLIQSSGTNNYSFQHHPIDIAKRYILKIK
jgi:hypothetical protein